MAANGLSGSGGRKGGGRDVVSGFEAAAIVEFGARGDPDDGGNIGQADFAGETAITIEPVDLAGNGDSSLLDAAVALIHVRGALETGGRSVGVESFDLGAQGWLVGLHGEEIIGLCIPDGRRDGRVGGDG